MRWTEVTEEGFQGGPVMPDNYDGSAASDRAAARQHRALRHRRQPGRQRLQVEHDRRAAARQGPEAPASASTTARCRDGSRQIRDKYEIAKRRQGSRRCACHVIGFAKLVGDLIDGLVQVMLYLRPGRGRSPPPSSICYTRCVRSTALVIACSLVAVVWQLGLVAPARLRARPVLDPGAVPGVRHRRVARRAEDERHHAGHRPRHAPAGGRALHLPPPVPGRPDRAAGRRGGLRGADGDRHPGDPGPGADRQHRRGGADLHQPDPAAGAAVLHRRQPGGRRSAACAPSSEEPAAAAATALWAVLDRFTERRWAHRRDRWSRPLLAVGRLRGEPAT